MHFTADGTLLESWASLKSFLRKDGAGTARVQSVKGEDSGNPTSISVGDSAAKPPTKARPIHRACWIGRPTAR